MVGVFLWWMDRRSGGDGPGLATWVGLAALTIALVSVGVAGLRGARNVEAGDTTPPADHRHAFRLFAVIGVLLAAGFGARLLAVPDGFGETGHFRAAAPTEARMRTPLHVGEETCAECHDEEVALHGKDVHAGVPCEDCHGPGGKHADDPEAAPLVKPSGKEPCLVCHRQLAARPTSFPQIRWKQHYAFVGVADESVECKVCHNPHEPLYLDRDVHAARLHPLVHRCEDCHRGGQDAKAQRPEGHPAIFECSYCHGDVVKDFATRTHAQVRCTTCHLFVRESDFAGRIIRDADPRFCLLCHRDAPFRSDDAPPGIEWPAHLEDVGEEEIDPKARCVDCHRDRIHAPRAKAAAETAAEGADEPSEGAEGGETGAGAAGAAGSAAGGAVDGAADGAAGGVDAGGTGAEDR